jgi:hypothetical protein
MIKKGILLCILLLGIISQFPIIRAVSKTYTWNPPPGDHEAFEIYVEAEDSWQTDLSTTVLIRVTLVDKHWSSDHVNIESTKVELRAPTFYMEERFEVERVTLENIEDHYERRIDFVIPSEKLNRGTNRSISIIWSININIVDNIQWKNQVYTWSNSDDPLIVIVFRPFLSTSELEMVTYAIIGIAGVTVGVTGYILYRIIKGRKREVVTREVATIPCAYCGTLMPETSNFCPHCGTVRKI